MLVGKRHVHLYNDSLFNRFLLVFSGITEIDKVF